MSLANYKPATVVVEFEGGPATVRGLSLDDITALLKDHLEDLDKLVRLLRTDELTPTLISDGTSTAIRLMQDAPAVVAQALAIASDEPEAFAVIRKMPAPVQIKLIKAVIELTFRDSGGIKKAIESLMKSPAGTALKDLIGSRT